jgi:hypothetical protein
MLRTVVSGTVVSTAILIARQQTEKLSMNIFVRIVLIFLRKKPTIKE